MELKITMQLKPNELQLVHESLSLYLQHLQDGEMVAIVGSDPIRCRAAVEDLLSSIGMHQRQEAGTYAVQSSFLREQ